MPLATLDSIKKAEGADRGEDDGSNEYYSGGADNRGGGSGLSVVGGPSDPNDAFGAVIARARNDGESGAADAVVGDEAVVTVTFYADGFTVEDGPLRTLDQPENRAFIEAVTNGFCPPELVKDGKPSNLRLQDKRGEKYTAPAPPAYVAFSGDGQKMDDGSAEDSAATQITPSDEKATPLEVDASQPTVRVQIRFPSKRVVAKFNRTHTVRDLFNLVEASELFVTGAGSPPMTYQLINQSRSPPVPIPSAEASALLTDLGLDGGVVIVKL